MRTSCFSCSFQILQVIKHLGSSFFALLDLETGAGVQKALPKHQRKASDLPEVACPDSVLKYVTIAAIGHVLGHKNLPVGPDHRVVLHFHGEPEANAFVESFRSVL